METILLGINKQQSNRNTLFPKTKPTILQQLPDFWILPHIPWRPKSKGIILIYKINRKK